jgi:hypothetical protein
LAYKNKKDLKEDKSQMEDDQLLMVAKKTYEHVKKSKEQISYKLQ